MKKFIFKLILWILIILIFVFSVCAGLGYLKYKSATDKLSLTNAVEQIKSKENYVKLEDISQGEKIEQDEDGMYFRTIETNEYEFGFTKDETDLYRLYITYPNDYNTYEYQNILENISITIDSKQVLKDD